VDDAKRLAATLNALVKSPQFSNSKARGAARQEPRVNWPATKAQNAHFNPDVEGFESFVMADGSTCEWIAGQFRYVAKPARP
jgi:hypothetical protein